MPRPAHDLATLIAPLSVAEFSSEVWGRRTWRRPSSLPAARTLLTAADLDAVLSLTSTGPEGLRLVRSVDGELDSRPIAADVRPDVFQLYQAFDDGFTIIVNSMEHRWGAVAALCEQLQHELSADVGANLYVTPPGSQGFLPHDDDHDVLIVQIEGSKRWTTFRDRTTLTRPRHDEQPRAEPTGDDERFTLTTGDVLYIPRGRVHSAATTDEFSIHLTVGIHATTWLDLGIEVLRQIAQSEAGWRTSLPPGFLHGGAAPLARRVDSLLGDLIRDGVDRPTTAAVETLDRALRARTRPAPDGHFSMLGPEEVGLRTRLRRRCAHAPKVERRDGLATIDFGAGGLQAPTGTFDALDFVSRTRSFDVADLPGPLTDRARVVLGRRLVRAGHHTVVRDCETELRQHT